jgi:hypothetical protein
VGFARVALKVESRAASEATRWSTAASAWRASFAPCCCTHAAASASTPDAACGRCCELVRSCSAHRCTHVRSRAALGSHVHPSVTLLILCVLMRRTLRMLNFSRERAIPNRKRHERGQCSVMAAGQQLGWR